MGSTWAGTLAIFTTFFAHLNCQRLSLDVAESGSFQVLLDGQAWLKSGEYRLGKRSSSDGLVLLGQHFSGGQDVLGVFNQVTLSWAATDASEKELMQTSFKEYPRDPGMLIFEQFFPEEITVEGQPWLGGDRHCYNDKEEGEPVTLFPTFQSSVANSAKDLDCFSYHGVFPQLKSCLLSNYTPSHQGGAPLVLFEAAKVDGGLPPMTVFSPLNHPKAQHMFAGGGLVGAGIKSTVRVIPAGWTMSFILSAGRGINDGMLAWGDRLLRYTGKPRTNIYADTVLSTIGFWTDNGGYYHYATGSNQSYEEVLPQVKAYHDSIGVPFRHWQFDSWFYPKDGPVSHGGGGGAVVNWTALPSVFPSGMAGIQAKLKVPMIMHNRHWSPRSDYIKNEPFKWYSSEKAAIPHDPDAFFKWFFTQQQGWGLAMYEQDWMCEEYDIIEALQTNISLADSWLHGMAFGAASSGRTVQYCMPYAHDILASAALTAVTNIRASDDYVIHDRNYKIGGTSMLIWAVGAIPFKDGFYSSNVPQVGGQAVGPELTPNRETLLATLSCAMVGPMDGINLLNKSRVMSTCRADGTILKPDRPLTPFESCFYKDAVPEECVRYLTYSDLSGFGRISYVFMDSPGTLSWFELIPAVSPSHVVFNWYSGERQLLETSVHIEAGYEGHSYAIVSPIVDGWAFFGEVGKIVTASRLRFASVKASNSKLLIHTNGIQGEAVKVCALRVQGNRMLCQVLSFKHTGTLIAELEAQGDVYV